MPQAKSEAHARPKCPECGTPNPAGILYGYPAWSNELEAAIEKGEIALGGCVVTGEDPAWRCVKCGHKWA